MELRIIYSRNNPLYYDSEEIVMITNGMNFFMSIGGKIKGREPSRDVIAAMAPVATDQKRLHMSLMYGLRLSGSEWFSVTLSQLSTFIPKRKPMLSIVIYSFRTARFRVMMLVSSIEIYERNCRNQVVRKIVFWGQS